MRKWAFFSMGAMAGIILVLGYMLLDQHRENLAYASSTSQDVGGATGTIIAVGGTQQNVWDMAWVLYRRPAGRAGAGTSSRITGDSRLTLAIYKVGTGSRGKMQLVSVRDISYDIEVIEWPNQSPSVREIKKQLEKQSKEKD